MTSIPNGVPSVKRSIAGTGGQTRSVDALERDVTARACRAAAIWLGLIEAQRAEWPDIVAQLYALHADIDSRLRRADSR